MISALFGLILVVVVAVLAGINVYQAYQNATYLRVAQSELAKSLRRENWAFFWLELTTIFLFAVLFVMILVAPEEPDVIVTVMGTIVALKGVIKLGTYKENFFFKKRLEELELSLKEKDQND